MGDESEYDIVKPICCSVNTFLCSNYLWAFLSLGMVVVGVVGIVINEGALVVLPPQAYFGVTAFGGFGLLVICCGVFGQKQRVELCFLIYILFVALGLIAQTLAYCFLLLYANDVGSIGDSFGGAVLNAQGSFESLMADFAKENADRWLNTQDALGCCGIDFEITQDEKNNVGGNEDPNVINSGARCTDNGDEVAALNDLIALFEDDDTDDNEYDADQDFFLPAQSDETIGSESTFFCKFAISEIIRTHTPTIGAILGLYVLIQIFALVSASRMYWVPEFLGGWHYDEEELEVVAARKGIAMPKKADDYDGNRVLSNIRAQTARLSYRFRNAMTADPDIPRDQGFLKRISMKRPVDDGGFRGVRDSNDRNSAGRVAFGQPNPAHNTRQTSNKRGGMFNRLSNRFFNIGKSGYIDVDEGQQSPSGTFAPKQPSMPPANSSYGSPPPPRVPQGSYAQSVGSRVSGRLTQGLKALGFSKPRQPASPPPDMPPSGRYDFDNGSSRPSLNSFYTNNGAPPPLNSNAPQQPSSFRAPPMPPQPPPSLRSTNISLNSQNRGYGGGFGSTPSVLDDQQDGMRGGYAGRQASGFGSRGTMGGLGFGGSDRDLNRNASGGFGSSSQVISKPELTRNKSAGRSFGFGRRTNGGTKVSKKPSRRTKAKPKKKAGGGGAPPAAGGLLAQIQQGTNLKKTVTNDRSAPKI